MLAFNPSFLAYEVSNGDGSWVAANGVDGRDHDFTGLTPSTCYDLNVRTKINCDNDPDYAPNVPQYSSVETIQKCAKPAACVITSVHFPIVEAYFRFVHLH